MYSYSWSKGKVLLKWTFAFRGAPKMFPLTNLVFWTNRLDPPPPWRLGHPQPKKKFWCLFCILGYSKHFIFSWKFSFFLVGIGWDWGILGSNNLMNWWDINPPFMYCVFHHISDHLQRLILFWQFYKKVGLRSDPPPWLVQKTKFVKGKIFGAPLTVVVYSLTSLVVVWRHIFNFPHLFSSFVFYPRKKVE